MISICVVWLNRLHLVVVLTMSYMGFFGTVSSKMLHVVTPSLSVVSSQPSISKAAKPSSSAGDASPAVLDFPEDIAKGPRNLSSTLHKLYLWEKKLYNEVKVFLLLTCCHILQSFPLSLLHPSIFRKRWLLDSFFYNLNIHFIKF